MSFWLRILKLDEMYGEIVVFLIFRNLRTAIFEEHFGDEAFFLSFGDEVTGELALSPILIC